MSGKRIEEEALERQLSYVEKMLVKYGAEPVSTKSQEVLHNRATYRFREGYFRMDSGDIEGRDYILISAIEDPKCADAGIMEEIAAFPADLSEELLEKEVRYALEIEDYPEQYPEYK